MAPIFRGCRKLILFLAVAVAYPFLLHAQSTALTGIAHAAFRVSDVEKSRAFYKTLGFEQAFEIGESGKTSVSYVKISDRQFVELYQRKEDTQPLGLLHVCFEAADLNALYQAYVGRGINPSAVKKAHAGNLLSVFHDPAGQVVEFTQYMPGSLHSEQKGKLLGAARISDRILRVMEPVENLQAEREFYTSKLGFNERDEGERVVLILPGDSGEGIEFAPSASEHMAEITFPVESVEGTIKELQRRGIAANKKGTSATIGDPDGNVILFVSRRAPAQH